MEKKSKKKIWLIVFALLLAIAVSAGIFVSELKKKTPTEGDEVISLLPETSDDTKEEEKDNQSVETDSDEASNSEGNTSSNDAADSNGDSAGNGEGQTEEGTSTTVQRTLYAAMETEDENQAWGSTTAIDIFDEFYQNQNEENTVENDGSDSMNLIAPGTEDSYTFWVKNTGEVSLDYKVWFEQIQTEGYDIPLEIRVKCGDTYVVGADDTWEDITALDSYEDNRTLKAKNYAQYTLEWRWPFEVDDDYDTYLGNEAVAKNIEQKIIIHTYGEADAAGWGGIGSVGIQTGDNAMLLGWSVLAVTMLVVIILLIREKKEEKNRE